MNRPQEYANTNAAAREDAKSAIREFSKTLAEMKGHCLDIGTGPGDVMIEIVLPTLHPSATVVCSDISKKMVEFVEKKYEDNDRVSCARFDVQTRKLPSTLVKKFDHVFSFNCLHWCRDVRRAYENIYDLLKPGGSLLVLFCLHHPYFNVYEILAARPKYQPYMEDVTNFVPFYQHCDSAFENYQSLFEDVGFETIHCTSREKTWLHKADYLEKFLMTVSPFVDRMPIEIQNEYQKDMMAELMKIFQTSIDASDPNGKPDVLFRWSVVVAYLRRPSSSQHIERLRRESE